MISTFSTQNIRFKCGDIVFAFDNSSNKSRPFLVLSNSIISNYYSDSLVLCAAITHLQNGQGFRIPITLKNGISYIRTDRDGIQSIPYDKLCSSGTAVKENIVVLVTEAIQLSIGYTTDDEILSFKEKLNRHEQLMKLTIEENTACWEKHISDKIANQEKNNKETENIQKKKDNIIKNATKVKNQKPKEKKHIFVKNWDDKKIKNTYEYILNHSKKENMEHFEYSSYTGYNHFEQMITAEAVSRKLYMNK